MAHYGVEVGETSQGRTAVTTVGIRPSLVFVTADGVLTVAAHLPHNSFTGHAWYVLYRV
jgi:hypothetical protein